MKNKNKIYITVLVTLILLIFGSAFIYDKYFNNIKTTLSNEEIIINKKIDNKNIPYINISEDEVNLKVQEIYKKYNDYNSSYDYYINNNTLSLVIKFSNKEETIYKTYNIDTDSKKEISNNELLKNNNIDENVSSLLESIFDNELTNSGLLNKYRRTHMYGDGFTSIYDASIMIFDSIRIDDSNMYLNKDNEVCLISKIYDPNSNKYIDKIFNLSTKSYEK